MFDWLRNLFGAAPSQKASSTLELFKEIYGGRPNKAGVAVNWRTALELSTMFACLRVLADGLAQVPLRVYRKDGKGREEAVDHPLYDLLYRAPNALQTSFEFRETLMFHLGLTGNAFAHVRRVGRAREVREIRLIEPNLIRVEIPPGEDMPRYTFTDRGVEQVIPSEEMWHLRGPSWNSAIGLDLVKLSAELIGTTIAVNEMHASIAGRAPRLGGVFALKDPIPPERWEKLASWIDRHMAGGDREGKPLVVDSDAKWTNPVVTAVEGQYVEFRRLLIEEICRVYRVSPLMIGHARDGGTNAAMDSVFIHHVTHCLSPQYSRIEQSADVKLLSPQERKDGYYVKFTANGLMRGSWKDRGEYFARALGSGGHPAWLTVNDVRGLEDLDWHPDGDELNPGANAINAAGVDPQPKEPDSDDEPA